MTNDRVARNNLGCADDASRRDATHVNVKHKRGDGFKNCDHKLRAVTSTG